MAHFQFILNIREIDIDSPGSYSESTAVNLCVSPGDTESARGVVSALKDSVMGKVHKDAVPEVVQESVPVDPTIEPIPQNEENNEQGETETPSKETKTKETKSKGK